MPFMLFEPPRSDWWSSSVWRSSFSRSFPRAIKTGWLERILISNYIAKLMISSWHALKFIALEQQKPREIYGISCAYYCFQNDHFMHQNFVTIESDPIKIDKAFGSVLVSLRRSSRERSQCLKQPETFNSILWILRKPPRHSLIKFMKENVFGRRVLLCESFRGEKLN